VEKKERRVGKEIKGEWQMVEEGWYPHRLAQVPIRWQRRRAIMTERHIKKTESGPKTDGQQKIHTKQSCRMTAVKDGL